jgi:hypothetical protein
MEVSVGAHWIGEWVGPRAGLDAVANRKISSPCQDSNPRSPVLYHWANPTPITNQVVAFYSAAYSNTGTGEASVAMETELISASTRKPVTWRYLKPHTWELTASELTSIHVNKILLIKAPLLAQYLFPAHACYISCPSQNCRSTRLIKTKRTVQFSSKCNDDDDDIRIDLRETGREGVDWTHLARNRDQWRTLVTKIMNLWVP